MALKWNSPEFWAALRPEIKYVAINDDGDINGFSDRPSPDAFCWSCAGHCWELDALVVSDLPSDDDWEESLIARPHEWRVPDENTPRDARVWYRGSNSDLWSRGHYARNGECYNGGCTSWTVLTRYTFGALKWKQIVLADPDNPWKRPPEDWRPELKEEPKPPDALEEEVRILKGQRNLLCDALARYTGRTVPEELQRAEKLVAEGAEEMPT